jgi:hypothetical protein
VNDAAISMGVQVSVFYAGKQKQTLKLKNIFSKKKLGSQQILNVIKSSVASQIRQKKELVRLKTSYLKIHREGEKRMRKNGESYANLETVLKEQIFRLLWFKKDLRVPE